jgi:hypothetical protein
MDQTFRTDIVFVSEYSSRVANGIRLRQHERGAEKCIKMLAVKTQGKRSLGSPGQWEHNIKVDL